MELKMGMCVWVCVLGLSCHQVHGCLVLSEPSHCELE